MKPIRCLLLPALVAAAFGPLPAARAAPSTDGAPALRAGVVVDRLTATDASAGADFASALSIDGDTLAVGAVGAGGCSFLSDCGAAYVFEWLAGTGWLEVAKIEPPSPREGDGFGGSVDLWGDTLAVSAAGTPCSFSKDNCGAVHLFERSIADPAVWEHRVEIPDPMADEGDNFGLSIGLDGDVLVIGAPGDFSGFFDQDSMGVIHGRDVGGTGAWGRIRAIDGSDSVHGDRFGIAADAFADVVAVGATEQGGEGAVYLFQADAGGPDNWGEIAKIVPFDGAHNDEFGSVVRLDGDLLAVGAIGDDGLQGSVYIYERDRGGPDNWGLAAKLRDFDGEQQDLFGSALALEDGLLAVGAYNVVPGGAVYLYGRDVGGPDQWGRLALLAPPLSFDDVFGATLTLGPGRLVVGNPDADDEAGEAWAISQPPTSASTRPSPTTLLPGGQR